VGQEATQCSEAQLRMGGGMRQECQWYGKGAGLL
jgi:hypothetical protein